MLKKEENWKAGDKNVRKRKKERRKNERKVISKKQMCEQRRRKCEEERKCKREGKNRQKKRKNQKWRREGRKGRMCEEEKVFEGEKRRRRFYFNFFIVPFQRMNALLFYQRSWNNIFALQG